VNARFTAIYLLAAVSLPVLAAEETKIWSGDVEVGAVSTSGNTEQDSIKLRFDATRDKDKFINSFHADTFQASASGDDTADKFYTFYRLDYRLDDERRLFGRLDYEDDAFSGFDRRASLVFGYNQSLLNREDLTIKGDIGLGARYIETDSGDSSTDATVRLAGLLTWDVSENARFTQLLEFDVSEDLTTTRSETALTANIVGSLAMKLAVVVRHNSEVVEGKEKTDTESTVTLVYNF
jgi:putative salt-induced outer membrane protein